MKEEGIQKGTMFIEGVERISFLASNRMSKK